MRHPTFQREGEREASGSFTVDLWLLGIFGVYLSDALSDLYTGKERGSIVSFIVCRPMTVVCILLLGSLKSRDLVSPPVLSLEDKSGRAMTGLGEGS